MHIISCIDRGLKHNKIIFILRVFCPAFFFFCDYNISSAFACINGLAYLILDSIVESD